MKVAPACVFDERTLAGLYRRERHCLTHQGYTIKGSCPRAGEEWDLSTVEGLARAIDPGAWPTAEQIEVASVCRVSNPYPEGRVREETHHYEDRRRGPIESAGRVLRLLDGGPAVPPQSSRWVWTGRGDEGWSSPEGYDDGPDQGVHRFDGGLGDGSFL